MPKSMKIKPEDRLKGEDIKFDDIKKFKYNKTLKDELDQKVISEADAIEIYIQMRWIRTYEMFLDTIKTKGEWKGIAYEYHGPAHMAMGQEAAAVGLYFLTDKDDFIFGTHRNHAEVISKGFSAIYKMNDQELEAIMAKTLDGKILENIETLGEFKTIREKAIAFFMYGFTAEVWGKAQGFNRGLAGSMHLFFTPFGIYPNNAIVGAGFSLAFGAAMFKLINKKPGIAIGNAGDGAVSTGPSWETLNFAAMDQFKELWEGDYQKRPPLMLNIMNNSYGMGGQTMGETMGNKGPARVGAGINPEGLYAEVVNGQDPLAVIDLIRRKKPIVLKGDGPVMNEIITYRYNGHSSGDLESYRTPEEVELWRAYDPLDLFSKELINTKVFTKEQIELLDQEIEDKFLEIYKISIDPELTTDLDWEGDQQVLDDMMFSREKFQTTSDKEIEVKLPLEKNPRVQRIAKRSRYAFDENGQELSKMKTIQIRDAIFEAIIGHYYKEPTFIGWGEELRDWGGAYGVYNGLTESLPYHRLFNSPIAEAAIVGAAIGYAMCGGQAIVELMYFDFLFRAGDEMSNQISKWRAMSGGELRIPVVVRTNIGSQYGVQHSQDYTSVITSITGINVVAPVTPYDAKGLMNSALASADPTFFIESQKLYDKGELFVKEGVPTGYYEIPFGEGVYRTRGEDITIVTLGASLYTALDAIKVLKEKWNISAELIDMRSAVPFNYEILVESVKKTGRMLLVNEGFERSNFMKNVAHNTTELAFDYFDAPPVVVASRNWIMPGADYEKYIYPQVDDILAAINEKIIPLKDFTSKKIHTNVEMIRRNKKGV